MRRPWAAAIVFPAAPPLAPAVRDGFLADDFAEHIDHSGKLVGVCRRLATAAGIAVLNAGEVVTVGGADGVHFTGDNHRTLGQAVAQHVKTMLPADQQRP